MPFLHDNGYSRFLAVTLSIVTILLFTFSVAGGDRTVQASLVTGPVHNTNTGLNYATIQEAIDALETLGGHTIRVDAGTYFEHVIVSKSLTLTGEDTVSTVIDGGGTGTVVLTAASNVRLTGFTIRNSGHNWDSQHTVIDAAVRLGGPGATR